MILDITAGKRRMWKEIPEDIIFLDRRKEVKPNIVASNENLPFIPECIDIIVYDPPQLYRHSKIKEGTIMARWARDFTLWKSKNEFLHNLFNVNIEAARVLKKNGTLFMKHCDGNPSCHVALGTVKSLLEKFLVIDCEKVQSIMHRNTTYWLTFLKKGRN